ncbi:hypothetical protein RJ640_002703 [Escallonia rubra]|uniref:CCHC-type domain-containing protein n=1 Tax=Escallonia rubra TaxID=112253 RepID=A0AA88RR23_9ASTE|nr:hypothetical protein RJ640_002703 [Escallonia rubra]
MSNNTTMKYACEQFDGKTNFGIWQSTVKDILVQQGLLKPLLGNKPESMDQDDWEELQAKAVSTIRGRSRSRNSGHGNDRSKSRGKQNKSNIECWYCKGIGHIARKCPERKDKKNGKKHVNNANVAEEDDKSSDGDLYLVSSVEQQEGGVMKVSKGAMVIMKGQKIGNLYKLIGNTVIGGASVSTHVGSSNDNSELWHKRLGQLSEGACVACGALYALIAYFTGFACLLSCFYRSKMRRQYMLQEDPCWDFLVHCCCDPCALCQEYRELKHRGFDMALGWQGNMEKQQRGVAMAPVAMAPVAQGMSRY